MPSPPAGKQRHGNPAQRFGNSARLGNRRAFDRTMRKGRKLVGRGILAWIATPPEGTDGPRLGLSVSRKVGNSPRRNRIKRVLREAFRQARATLPDVDIVIVVRPDGPPLTLLDAHRALLDVVRRRDQRPRRKRPARRGQGGAAGRGDTTRGGRDQPGRPSDSGGSGRA